MSDNEPNDLSNLQRDWSNLQRDFGVDELGMAPMALKLIRDWPSDGEERLIEIVQFFVNSKDQDRAVSAEEFIRRAKLLQDREETRRQAELNNPSDQAQPALSQEPHGHTPAPPTR